MNTYDRLQETLAAWQRLWVLYYPPKGERRRKGTALDISGLQETWNAYTRANIAHHGQYVATTEPHFGESK